MSVGLYHGLHNGLHILQIAAQTVIVLSRLPNIDIGSSFLCGEMFLSVTLSKDQAGSTDRGRPIPSKFSVFFSLPNKFATGGIFSKLK